jgi:F-type H+-transporting ATPase subunit b
MMHLLAADGPNGRWIPSDVNEFYWGAAAFTVIVVLFIWKGLPAIRQMFADQTASVETELADAAKAKADAEAELASLQASLGDADAESAAILEDARAQATKLEADLVAKAEADIEDAKQRSMLEIAAQREQALADIRVAVAEQARIAADAVVRNNLDDSTQSALIDDYISAVASS